MLPIWPRIFYSSFHFKVKLLTSQHLMSGAQETPVFGPLWSLLIIGFRSFLSVYFLSFEADLDFISSRTEPVPGLVVWYSPSRQTGDNHVSKMVHFICKHKVYRSFSFFFSFFNPCGWFLLLYETKTTLTATTIDCLAVLSLLSVSAVSVTAGGKTKGYSDSVNTAYSRMRGGQEA